jgi:hypothetical protein
MASNINPLNIDGNFPIAGQDNDSQGFRDNFTNTKTNLNFAKFEIEDLQSRALLKSALTGTTLDNDLNNAVLYRAQLKAQTETFKDLGVQTGPVPVSFLDGTVQKITTGGPITIGLSDFPASGSFGKIRLWIDVPFTTHTVTLPVNVTLGTSTVAGLNIETMTISYSQIGSYLYEFSTVDGGLNFWALQLA